MFDYNEWYKQNKEILSRKRKRKYRNDLEYRETIKYKAKKWYDDNKKGSKSKLLKIEQDGSVYCTIGRLSQLLGKSPFTLRDYHKRGIIPIPSKVDNRGWRLYTKEQVDILITVFKLFEKSRDSDKRVTLKDVKQMLHKKWRA